MTPQKSGVNKEKPIIIQEPQKLRKELHKIVDKTYNLGWNSALKEIIPMIYNMEIRHTMSYKLKCSFIRLRKRVEGLRK